MRDIQNAAILRILIENARYFKKSVKAYSGTFRMLFKACTWRTLLYSELCPCLLGIFRHIQACSIMIVLVWVNWYGGPKSEPKVFRTWFVKRP